MKKTGREKEREGERGDTILAIKFVSKETRRRCNKKLYSIPTKNREMRRSHE
jgi:hypothetical protein